MSDRPVVNIGICGLGTVGQGVWKHITRSRAKLEARLGARLKLQRASVRDLTKKRAVRVGPNRLTTDSMSIVTDPSIHIVCELIGGTTLAKDLTLAALKLGKTVVSANKALICEHGPEIFAAARAHGGHYFFEAAVAGGIPIIKALREGLVANRFDQIYGILNGTCNYILTRMEREGLPYEEILKEAKALGYAEADESLDVDGGDTAHKAAILAYLAHGDIVDAVTLLLRGNAALPEPIEHKHPLCPPEHIKGSYYLRLNVKDEPGVLAKIASVTARAKVSIASLQQRACATKGEATLILTTHQSNEKAITSVIKKLSELPTVLEAPLLIRIASFRD